MLSNSEIDQSGNVQRLEGLKRDLYTPVVGDVLDQFGFEHQFLSQPVQPMREAMKVMGRAMPVLQADVYGQQAQPFGRLTEALDQLEPGEVWVASGGLMRSACWGEILTATACQRGAVGAVVNGFHRDTRKCWSSSGRSSRVGGLRRIRQYERK